MPKTKKTGFDASALQILRAYKSHFGITLADSTPFSVAGDRLVFALGMDQAHTFVQSQSNDPFLAD